MLSDLFISKKFKSSNTFLLFYQALGTLVKSAAFIGIGGASPIKVSGEHVYFPCGDSYHKLGCLRAS